MYNKEKLFLVPLSPFAARCWPEASFATVREMGRTVIAISPSKKIIIFFKFIYSFEKDIMYRY